MGGKNRTPNNNVKSQVCSNRKDQGTNISSLNIIHHNVQNLSNKVIEIEVLLQSRLKNIDIMCITEHWQNREQIKTININNFKLVSAHCRENYMHGGSCILVKENIQTKECNNFQNLNQDKEFELSAIEVENINVVIICIYRTPDSNFQNFLHKLEIVIQKLTGKNKSFILCGDWNVDFLQSSSNLLNLHNLLLMYNLVNIIKEPTRVTKHSKTLLDVIILRNPKDIRHSSVLNLGFSDHEAQLLDLQLKNRVETVRRVKKREINSRNIEEFQIRLQQEKWEEVYTACNTNSKFDIFLESFLYYYNVAFPIKNFKTSKPNTKSWITKGIQICSNKLRLFSRIQKTGTLNAEIEDYVNNYRKIYKRVLKEAKRKDNDRFILTAQNKTKATWQVIDRETGKDTPVGRKIELNSGKDRILHPQVIADLFNTYPTSQK